MKIKGEKEFHSLPRNRPSFNEDLPSKTRKTFHFLKPAGFERSENNIEDRCNQLKTKLFFLTMVSCVILAFEEK